MKQNYLQKSIAAIWAIAFLLVAYSCSQIETFEPNMDSNDLMQDGSKFNLTGPLVEPINWAMRGRPDGTPGQDKDKDPNGGNVECSELDMEYASSSGRNNYNDGEFEDEWPEGLTVDTDGVYLKWSFEAPEGYCLSQMAIIVKGGPAANVYIYEGGGYLEDDGLSAPIEEKLSSPDNPNGKPAGLSNLTFCWNLELIPEEPKVEGGAVCFDEDLKLTAKVTSEIPDGIIIKWYDQEVGGESIKEGAEGPSLSTVDKKTYWAEAVRGACASARVHVTLEIFAVPEAPVSDGDLNECEKDVDGKLTASATASPGATIVWYTAATEGTVVPDPSLDKSGEVTYWAEAQIGSCVSAERTPVTLKIRDCSDNGGGDYCGSDTAFSGPEGGILGSEGWFYLMDYKGDEEVKYPLWGGRDIKVGEVTLKPNGTFVVDVTVTLEPGVVLQEQENWYVHGYTSEPANRPKGGQKGDAVTWERGTADSAPFTVSVPRNGATIFAVHINVQKECD